MSSANGNRSHDCAPVTWAYGILCPAMVSPNASQHKEDKLLYPDHYLVWYAEVDSGPHTTVLSLSMSAQRLSFRFFFLEGHHLGKILLGANVTKREKLILLSFIWCSRVLFLSSFTVVVKLSKSMTCLHFHSFIYSRLMLCNKSKNTGVT